MGRCYSWWECCPILKTPIDQNFCFFRFFTTLCKPKFVNAGLSVPPVSYQIYVFQGPYSNFILLRTAWMEELSGWRWNNLLTGAWTLPCIYIYIPGTFEYTYIYIYNYMYTWYLVIYIHNIYISIFNHGMMGIRKRTECIYLWLWDFWSVYLDGYGPDGIVIYNSMVSLW